jgi:hypothetical protein
MPNPKLLGGEQRSNMKLELLHIADCSNSNATRRLLSETLRELGLTQEILEIEVSDSLQAEALSFPGPPTIRVDGIGVEAGLPPNGNGLSCRIYIIDGKPQAAPTREMIRTAIRSAQSRADPEVKRA